MAAQSTLKLATVDPEIYAAIRHARHPPRRLWVYLIRLLLQYAVTVPVVLLATPFVILRNLFPFLRKHPAWTFKTGVSSTLVRLTIICMGLIRFAPAPHDEYGWLQGDSTVGGGLVAFVVQLLAWRSYGQRIWADTKSLPRLGHLHGKRLDEVWVGPPPADWLRGILAVRNPAKSLDEQQSFSPLYQGYPMIQPEFAKRRVKCYWYLRSGRKFPPIPEEGDAKRTGPVLLWTHGGAGVSFSAGDNFMGASLAAVLARTADIDVFTIDYDLAPYAKYPTTLVQIFAAWLYLVVDLEYHPSQIFIGGDSYGGFSTVLFDRYLRDVWRYLEAPSTESFAAANPSKPLEWANERAKKFTALLGGKEGRKPVPTAGMILFSPWLYTQEDYHSMFPHRTTAMAYDIVTNQYQRWGAECLELTPQDIERNNLSLSPHWVNPVFMPTEELAALPPTWIGNGGAECLLLEGTYFARRIHDAGGDVEHLVEVGMIHDFYSIPFEVNNAKKHYRILNPWIKTHYEAAQRRAGQSESTALSTTLTSVSTSGEKPGLGATRNSDSGSPTASRDVEANPLDDSLTQSGIVINEPSISQDPNDDADSTIKPVPSSGA